MFVAFEVSKDFKSTSFKELHPYSIPLKLVTFEVSKSPNSTLSSDSHAPKTADTLSRLDVSKPSKLIVFKDRQYSNICVILSTRLVSKPSKLNSSRLSHDTNHLERQIGLITVFSATYDLMILERSLYHGGFTLIPPSKYFANTKLPPRKKWE